MGDFDPYSVETSIKTYPRHLLVWFLTFSSIIGLFSRLSPIPPVLSMMAFLPLLYVRLLGIRGIIIVINCKVNENQPEMLLETIFTGFIAVSLLVLCRFDIQQVIHEWPCFTLFSAALAIFYSAHRTLNGKNILFFPTIRVKNLNFSNIDRKVPFS